MRYIFIIKLLSILTITLLLPNTSLAGPCATTISNATTNQLDCADDDELTVTTLGSISYNDHQAVDLEDESGVQITNNGTIETENGTSKNKAINAVSSLNTTITNNGTINSDNNSAVYLDYAENVTITNNSGATISAEGDRAIEGRNLGWCDKAGNNNDCQLSLSLSGSTEVGLLLYNHGTITSDKETIWLGSGSAGAGQPLHSRSGHGRTGTQVRRPGIPPQCHGAHRLAHDREAPLRQGYRGPALCARAQGQVLQARGRRAPRDARRSSQGLPQGGDEPHRGGGRQDAHRSPARQDREGALHLKRRPASGLHGWRAAPAVGEADLLHSRETRHAGKLGLKACQPPAAKTHALFRPEGRDLQNPLRAAADHVDASDQAILLQERIDVVAVGPLRGGDKDLDPVGKAEQAFRALAVAQYRVERA